MKTINYIYSLLSIVVIMAMGCEKDNFDAPTSMLTGRVVHQGQPLGLRSGGVQLELWQHGYDLFSKIPIHVDQDGSFSARLFDGNYKLVLLRGNGPWADNTDSLDVNLKGTASVDVPVDPYFIITNQSFQRNGNEITGTVTIQQVNTSRSLERVAIYLGQTLIVDQNNSAARAEVVSGAIADFNQPIELTVSIPASLADKGYLFARIGVKATGVAEYLYSQPQQITL
ncbi:hypothetical protein GCM10007415_04610 [Parapedobacter pyrenivorans]|uniref:DUF3823 domain-containing protein n=1 Tax=Parapedobacter pyrenivorans TaxID=1305674 RepID=A0A917M309_9SPHI|nr:DUF3823 domain-containing protein [Parapedobacter pyrenivorans]GGG75990.1 hypothetical protein GCM10007415_04610 [Parapedobacter pyrenivorans]